MTLIGSRGFILKDAMNINLSHVEWGFNGSEGSVR